MEEKSPKSLKPPAQPGHRTLAERGAVLLEEERFWGLMPLSCQGLIERADPGSAQGAW